MALSTCKIWVFIETRQGNLAEVSLELLGKALELAEKTNWSVAAVLLGNRVSSLAEEMLSYGVDEVIVADDPLLEEYCNQVYTKVLHRLTLDSHPEVFLLGATALGVDLAPRLAARLRTGLSAHCIDLEMTNDGELLAVVPGWGGNVMAKISCPKSRPQMATVKPGVFDIPAPGSAKGQIISFETDLDEKDLTYKVVETFREESSQSGLDSAEVVVAGGWGIGSEENWKLIEDLASALGGAVGATRPPIDEGWAEESQMIGTSGRTVKPKLYIGVGISGHMHHLVGIKNPGMMIGINSDQSAPIFDHCTLGIAGDFTKVVPHLIKEIKTYLDK